MSEKTFNAENETQVKGRKRKDEIRREREMNDLRFVMGHEQGRRFVWRLLTITGITRSSFETNALSMAMKEGQRNVGLTLTAEIMEADTKSYLTMQLEAANLKEIDNAE